MLRRTVMAFALIAVLVSTTGATSCEAVGPGGTSQPETGVVPKNEPRPYPQKDKKKNETDSKIDNKGESLTYRAKWTGNGRKHKPYILYSVHGTLVSAQNVKIEWGSWEKTLTNWGPPVDMQITQEDVGRPYQMECWIIQGTRTVAHNKTDSRYSDRSLRCSVKYAQDFTGPA